MVKSKQITPVICKLNSGSLDDIVRIENESSPCPWSKRLIHNEFIHDFSTVFGVRVNGCIEGFMVVHVVVDEAHIMNLAVSKCIRGQGIGRAMVKEILEELFWKGVQKVFLEVRVSNQVALNLYQSIGFVRLGLRKSYYTDNGEDAALMMLHLDQFISQYGDPAKKIVNF